MEKINSALILCAGYGKRLNPLTLKNPKPLLKIKNTTLLENTINIIIQLGIKNIKINTFEGEYEKNIEKKVVNATKREHIKKIDNIKNDKIKKSLLEFSKIFRPK